MNCLAPCRFDTVDVHKRGRIGYGEFLSMLVPRGDNKPSMYHDSFKSYMRKGSFYSLVPQGVAPLRIGTNGKLAAVGKLSVRDIQQVMKKKLSTEYTNMKSLLDHRDQDGTGFVSKHLLLQVLRKLDVFITLPQLEEVQRLPRFLSNAPLYVDKALLLAVAWEGALAPRPVLLWRSARAGTDEPEGDDAQVLEAQTISIHGDSVRISDFMAKFLVAGGSSNGGGGWQTDRPSTKAPVDNTALLNRLRAGLRGRLEDVQAAFFEEQDQAADFKVGREEVARVLARFGVPITQDQGRALFETLGDSIDYLDFVRLLDLGSRASRLPTTARRLATARSNRR